MFEALKRSDWKIDIKNSQEYDQAAEDSEVAELISQREEEESLQREAEQRLEAEQAERAAEDARLRELYPLPEDDEEYGDERYDEETVLDNGQTENLKQEELLSKEEKTR